VSGRHAELHQVGTSLSVVDLGSTNGTYLNGARITCETELHDGDVLQFGTAGYKVRACSQTPLRATVETDATASALGRVLFDRLLDDPAVVPFFQPIVQLDDDRIVGYEVLARSRLIGLKTPLDMFRIASERSMELRLSALLRNQGVRVGQQLQSTLYLNTHPVEVGDPQLLESLTDLRDKYPDIPLTLEIHEAAVTSSSALTSLGQHLADLGIGLAYDDFGAGQARLRELADAPPDVIKFDVSLVRGLPDASSEHKQLLQCLVDAVRALSVKPLAEGVETQDEADACREIGFELGQGYLFGRPAAIEMPGDRGGADNVPWFGAPNSR